MRPRTILSSLMGLGALAAAAIPSLGAAQQAIENVVVTATRMPRNVEDVAGTVSVITSEEIERQIAEDLDDLVRYQPGISMDTAGRGGNQGFIIRGIGGNRVLTVVDGVRSNDQYLAGPSAYGKDLYETDDLSAVEIIRGPASVLYGADAMGGAVILHTKDPVDYVSEEAAFFLGARLSCSSEDEQRKIGITGAVDADRFGVLAQYTARNFEETERGSEVSVNPLDGRSQALLLKTTLDLDDRNALTFALDALEEVIDIRLDNEVSGGVTRSVGRDESDRVRLSIGHTWRGGANLLDELESHVYWQAGDGLQHTEQQRTSFSFVNPANPATFGGTEARRVTDFEFNQTVRGLALTASKAVSSGSAAHHVVYGLTLERTHTERPRNRCETEVATGAVTCSIAAYPLAPTEDFPNRTFPDTETSRDGLFVQDEIGFGARGRVTLIPGIRYDRYAMDPTSPPFEDIGSVGFEVTPTSENNVSANLGLLYDVGDALTFVVQYAEGFRPPNFDESNQAFVNRAFGYAVVPNPDLRPETSRGVEIGMRSTKSRARYALTVYRNDYEDFIGTEFVGIADGISLFQDTNIDRVRIEGLEMSGRWLVADRWELFGSLAHARGEDIQTGAPLDSIDPLTGVLGMSFASPSDRWNLDTVLTVVSDKDRVSAADRVTAEAYELVDVIGRLRLGAAASLRLGVYNLADETYARWANIQGLPASGEDAVARAFAPGRNVRLSFDVDFR